MLLRLIYNTTLRTHAKIGWLNSHSTDPSYLQHLYVEPQVPILYGRLHHNHRAQADHLQARPGGQLMRGFNFRDDQQDIWTL